MKECFTDKKFDPEAEAIIAEVDKILARFAANGYDLTLRQIFYQFISFNLFPDDRTWRKVGKETWVRDPTGTKNAEPNYKGLGGIVIDARMAGRLDWDMIRDRGRVTRTHAVFPDLKVFLQRLNETYRRDKWAEQPNYVEVMIEKQALEGVLYPVCERWDVAITANKGYSSGSSMYERAKHLQTKRDVEHKDVHMIYMGDHDPSGIDMSRDVADRLQLFSDGPVQVHRVALNYDQVMRHNLPENNAKEADSRAAEYVERFGPHSWELDALSPDTLVTVLEHAIRGLIDPKKWKGSLSAQEEDQDQLQDIIDKLPT